MSEDNDYLLVKQSPLATDMDEAECRALAAAISHRVLADGETLLAEGEVSETLYVIVRGRLAAVKETGGGDSVVLHLYREGEMVGELGFIDAAPHSAGVRAEGEAEVFALERGAFEALLPEHPHMVYKAMKGIVRTVHTILRRMNVQYVELTNYITKQHGKY